ncbi:MAG: phage terminase large subunit family protein [Rhodobacteraceae bacterium]|nr:phage terminase large subunit family protein [Paracoccaceae bacterium]
MAAQDLQGQGRAELFVIGVDALKDRLAARLNPTEPGPGYVHFSDQLPTEWFDQLTAEKVRLKYVNGRPVRQWVPRGDSERNEALDCNVYAAAALHSLYAARLRLNEEVERLWEAPLKHEESGRRPIPTPSRVIRSSWMDG